MGKSRIPPCLAIASAADGGGGGLGRAQGSDSVLVPG